MQQMDELAQAAMELDSAEEQAQSQMTVEELDQKLQQLREMDNNYKEKKKISDEAHAELAKAKVEMMGYLEALGRNSYALPGIGIATMVTENKYKMPADTESREALFKYIRDNYDKNVLYSMTSIHHDNLNTFIKQEQEQGRTVPGLSTPTTNTYVKFTKR